MLRSEKKCKRQPTKVKSSITLLSGCSSKVKVLSLITYGMSNVKSSNNHLVANIVILHNVEAMTMVIKELQNEGMHITQEVLAGLSPYRTHHVNHFGNYTLDRKICPMKFETKIL
jgi:hypothetical protein